MNRVVTHTLERNTGLCYAWSPETLLEIRKRAGRVLSQTPRQEADGRTAELREMAEHVLLLSRIVEAERAEAYWLIEGWSRRVTELESAENNTNTKGENDG